MPRRTRGLAARALSIVAIATLLQPVLGTVAGTQLAPPAPFSGTAAALGLHLKLTIPGGPATDVPVDGGGPTAQATLDSLGTSQGYASFPDPGQFIVSIPGLATGLISAGAAGLPPIPLPSLPAYPLYVSSDAGSQPEQTVGSGAYQITAKSTSTSATAKGAVGLENLISGNTALVSAVAKVESVGDTTVSEAISNIEGLTIGPLTIGQIRTRATMTRDRSGTTTPSSDIAISALRIGGVPVAIRADGIDLAGNLIPLPIGDTLNTLLDAFGITIEIAPGSEVEAGVSAPALRITAPFDTFGIGTGPGTATLVLGSSTARLVSFVDDPDDGSVVAPDEGAVDVPGLGAPGLGAPVGGDLPSLDPTSTPVGDGGTAPSPLVDAGPTELVSNLRFDLMSLYLTTFAVAVGWFVLSQIIRLLGVRARWT